MINTTIRKLTTTNVDWHVAHFFEHVVINEWYAHLEANGYHPALFGWIEGETFEDRLFISAEFYEDKVHDLFNAYIHSDLKLTDQVIQKSLDDIGAEEQSFVSVRSNVRLREQLENLMHDFSSKKHISIKKSESFLDIQENSTLYNDISLIITAEKLTHNEQIVLLRFKVIIIDIIRYFIGTRYAYYNQGNSPFARSDHSMSFVSKITFRDGQSSLEVFAQYLQKNVQDFPINKHWGQIEAHFYEFAREPLWRDVALEYYRETGIDTTPNEISTLATADTIKSILSKISIQAKLHDPVLDQWIT